MDGLRAYNEERAGVSDARQLAILARDTDTGEVVGGPLGRSYLGLLTVERFFLPENLRCGGLGGRILAMPEEEGRRRSCTRAVLSTLHFQAPGFYLKQGWEVTAWDRVRAARPPAVLHDEEGGRQTGSALGSDDTGGDRSGFAGVFDIKAQLS